MDKWRIKLTSGAAAGIINKLLHTVDKVGEINNLFGKLLAVAEYIK